MELFLQSAVNSLIQSGFFILWAVGLVMVFGIMRVVNFAHGELVMVGAYAVWVLHAQMSVPFMLAILLAVAIATLVGMFMERFLFRPKRDDPLGGLICSIGALFILQVVAHLVGGTGPSKQVAPPFKGTTILFDNLLRIPNQRLFSLAVVIIVLLILWYFLTKTKLGWSLKAVALDREVAALQGININRTSMIAISISAAMAGLAGALMAPLTNINPHMGHNVIITSFIVTIVGGIGSLYGATLAAILYAVFHTYTTAYFDGTIATIGGLLIMVLTLTIKPTGITGKSISE